MQKMLKIKNETSGQHQILLKHQGSYGQQIPESIFTSIHRGRHRRAKRHGFAAKRDFRGDRSSRNETRAISGTTRSRRLARVPATRPAAGQPHSAILKIAPFLVIIIIILCKLFFAGYLLPQFSHHTLKLYVKSTGFIGNRVLAFC